MSRLNHYTNYTGTFTNRDGFTRAAYIRWNDEKKGFIVFDAETNRPLVNTAYPNIKAFREGKVNFKLGATVAKEMEPVA